MLTAEYYAACANALYSSSDCLGSSTQSVYMPSAVPSGTFNNATKPTTSAIVRAQSSRCNKPQPAKNPAADFASSSHPMTVSKGRSQTETSGGGPPLEI